MKILQFILLFIGLLSVADKSVALTPDVEEKYAYKNTNISYLEKVEPLRFSAVRYSINNVVNRLKSEHSRFVLRGPNIAKYGYDILRGDSFSGLNSLRLRGGLSKLSKDAEFGVQFIISW